jgi:hypothetical protein
MADVMADVMRDSKALQAAGSAWMIGFPYSPTMTSLIGIAILVLKVLASVAILFCTAWGALALWHQVPTVWLRWTLIVLWLLLGAMAVGAVWASGIKWVLPWGVAFAVMGMWWISISPSHDRVWADDVAEMLHAEVDGSRVTLHKVRNFEWRTREDYTARWETREYDLDRLVFTDAVFSYWTHPSIAHTLVSFGFDDGEVVTFSVEIRRERHEAFSAIGGFFKQFEMIVVAADERDIIRTRTNARGEDVYMYRLRMPQEAMRSLFMSFVDEAHDLRERPRFYNTLTANCTTIVFQMMRRIVDGLPLDYRLILAGWLPGYLEEVGGLDPRYSLEELREMGRITERARAAGPEADFSAVIREGMALTPTPLPEGEGR